jgi:hypothetical protein
MKRILIILGLFIIVINNYGQQDGYYDDLEVSNKLEYKGALIEDWLNDSTPASAIDGANGNSKVGDNIEWGNSSLNKDVWIPGTGHAIEIGTTASKAGDIELNSNSDIYNRADNNVYLSAGGIQWTLDGTNWINESGDTLQIGSVVDAKILAALPYLPYNYSYTYSTTTTDSRPGVGLFRLNNATYSNVTQIFIDNFDVNSVDKSDFLEQPDTGSYISIRSGVNYVNYQLTGALTAASSYYKYGVTYLSHSGVLSGICKISMDLSNNVGGGGGGASDSLFVVISADSLKNLTASGIVLQSTSNLRANSAGYISMTATGNYLQLSSTNGGASFIHLDNGDVTSLADNDVNYRTTGGQVVFDSDTDTIKFISTNDTVYIINNKLYSEILEAINVSATTVSTDSITSNISISDTIKFSTGNYMIDAPQDNLFKWDSINSYYTGFSDYQPNTFYFGVTNPTSTTRLNLDYYLQVPRLGATASSGDAGTFYSGTGNAIDATSNYGTPGYFNLSSTTNSTNPVMYIGKNSAAGSYNMTGDIISIDDSPATSGTVSGKVLTAVIGTTERISLNPRATSGEAYLFDSHSDVSAYTHTSWENQGVPIATLSGIGQLNINSVSVGGGDVMTSSDTVDGMAAIESNKFDKLQFNTSSQAYSPYMIFWDTSKKALTGYNDISGFSHNYGYEVVRRVYNNTGATIPNERFVRRTGTHVNDGRVATIALAGISSADSTNVWGMTTVSIPPSSYGIVTIIGDVGEANNSALAEDAFYCGFAGVPIDTAPPPPYYTIKGGEVLYSANGSGIYSVNIETPTFTPSPLFASDTSGINQTVTITTQDVYEYLPIGDCNIDNNFGFTVAGDSVQVGVSGYYQIVLSMSFQGNPTTEVWHYAPFINNVALPYKERSTSSSATGDANRPISRELSANDWVSFRIKNTSGTGDPTIQTLAIQILFLHE